LQNPEKPKTRRLSLDSVLSPYRKTQNPKAVFGFRLAKSRRLSLDSVFALFLYLMLTGLLNRGSESKTIRFSNASKITSGYTLGSKRVFLRKGQTFTADYEVQIETGGLYIRLRKLWAPFNTPATGQLRVKQSGSGQLRIPVPETGMYHLWIDGSPDRDGYDLSYTVS